MGGRMGFRYEDDRTRITTNHDKRGGIGVILYDRPRVLSTQEGRRACCFSSFYIS